MATQPDFAIRHAQPSDLPRIMQIYEHARAFMAEHGNPTQWGAYDWPPENLIRSDIESERCYVCTAAGRVVGTFFYDYGADPEPSYRSLEDGRWTDDSPYGVVHRIASDGSVPGVGTYCLSWAFGQCGHLRIDTYAENTVMRGLLTKLGFRECGQARVEEDVNLHLVYEKVGDA